LEITVWITAIVVFLIVEALTPSLVSIWFAAGSLAALFTAMLGADLYIQIIVFLVISGLLVFIVKKFYKNTLTDKKLPDVSERFIGTEVMVIETVDNLKETGFTKISGVEWSLKSENGEIIPEGAKALVVAIEGVKLIVKTVI